MRKSACWVLSLSLCLSNLWLPGSAWAEATTEELTELILLQKDQIEDYKSLDAKRQEQISQLNASLNECRDDLNKQIDTTARATAWTSGGAITGYLIGLVGVVFGATVYAVKR